MSQHPLKLLHLPLVVLRNVLQFLNPIELFELSQCSRNALSVIPLSGSKNLKHFFSAYNNLIQANYSLHGTRTFMETTVKICHRSENELISFWDNRHVGLKSVFFHVSKVFKCPIECAKFSSACPAAIYMSIIDFISSRQSEIKELYVGGRNLTDEHVTEIFDKLRVTDHLAMRHQFSKPPLIPLNSKSMFISNSFWITSEHLKSMNNCTVIKLDRCTLTDHDMTSFLNDWKSGQFSNLQYLSIKSSFLSKNFTAFGLPSLQDTVNPKFFVKFIFGLSRSIYGAVNVQRDGGIVAKVSFDDQDGDLRILVL